MSGDDHNIDGSDNFDAVPDEVGPNSGLDGFFRRTPSPSAPKGETPAGGEVEGESQGHDAEAADQDLPELEPIDDEPAPSSAAAPESQEAEAREPESEEDVLFAGEADQQPGATFGSTRTFADAGGPDWAGKGLPHDEIGIPNEDAHSNLADDDELGIDSDQELELIDVEAIDGEEDAAGAAGIDLAADQADDELVLDEDYVLEDEVLEEEPTEPSMTGHEVFASADEESEARIEEALDHGHVYQEAAEAVGDGAEQPLPEEVYVLDEDQVFAEATQPVEDDGFVAMPQAQDAYPVEDGWEPLDHTAAASEEPVEAEGQEAAYDGDEADYQPAQAEAWETEDEDSLAAEGMAQTAYDEMEGEDQESSTFEEAYDEDGFQGEFEGEGEGFEEPMAADAELANAFPRRGRVLRMVASLAAAAVIVGGGSIVLLQPELVGLSPEPVVQQDAKAEPRPSKPQPQKAARPGQKNQPSSTTPSAAQGAQPTTPNAVETPAQPQPVATAPESSATQAAQPQPSEPQPAQPEPSEPQPAQPEPSEPQPVESQPSASQGPAPSPIGESVPAPVAAAPAVELPRYLPAGEALWIGEFDGGARAAAAWASVRLGGKAFAQLQNGNFFIGSVKSVAEDRLILMVGKGEVVLPRDEVAKVTTLDSGDYADLQRATTGFLKLSNNNRLVGAILESVVDDHYVLQMRSDRIVVPRSAVDSVVADVGNEGLRFGSLGGEEEWLRQVAAQKLQAMRATTAPPRPRR